MLKYIIDENVDPTYTHQLRRLNPDLFTIAVGDITAPAKGTLDPEILLWCEENRYSESPGLDNGDAVNQESNKEKTKAGDRTLEALLHETKLNSLSKLIELGLSAEQIAEALDLQLHEVREAMDIDE